MGAIENLTRLDDPPSLPTAQIDERIATGPIDSGEAQNIGFGAARSGRGRPAGFVLKASPSARGMRPRRACLVDPRAAVVAIDPNSRIIDDAPQRRRGGDRRLEAIERR